MAITASLSNIDTEQRPLQVQTTDPEMNVRSKLVITSAPTTVVHDEKGSAVLSLNRTSLLSQITKSSSSLQSCRVQSLDSLNETLLAKSPGERTLDSSFNGDFSAVLTPSSNRTSLENSPVPPSSFSDSTNSGSGTGNEMASYWSPWPQHISDASKLVSFAVTAPQYENGFIHSVPFGSTGNSNIIHELHDHHDAMNGYQTSATLTAALHACEEYQNVVYPHDVTIASNSGNMAASAWHHLLTGHQQPSTSRVGISAPTTTIIPTQTMVNCPTVNNTMEDSMRTNASTFELAKYERDIRTDWEMSFSDASPSSVYSLGGFFESPNHHVHQSPRLSSRIKKRPASTRNPLNSSVSAKRHQRTTSSSLLPPSSPSSNHEIFSLDRSTGSSSCTSGIHPQNRHLCTFCGKKFQRKEHLRRHEDTHNPDARKHDCPDPMCSKQFRSRADNLREHFKTHLRQTPSSRTKLPRTFDEFYGFIRAAYGPEDSEKEVARLEEWRARNGHLKSESAGGEGKRGKWKD